MKVEMGDVFCVEGSMFFVATAIKVIEKLQSKDNQAKYGHAGIVTSGRGATFEALWVTKHAHIDNYIGQNIMVARPLTTATGVKLTYADKKDAVLEVESIHSGDIYPFWRLFFHLIPGLAKYATLQERYLVCSELVASYLKFMGCIRGPATGRNPDDLADMFEHRRHYKVLYEGKWPGLNSVPTSSETSLSATMVAA